MLGGYVGRKVETVGICFLQETCSSLDVLVVLTIQRIPQWRSISRLCRHANATLAAQLQAQRARVQHAEFVLMAENLSKAIQTMHQQYMVFAGYTYGGVERCVSVGFVNKVHMKI